MRAAYARMEGDLRVAPSWEGESELEQRLKESEELD